MEQAKQIFEYWRANIEDFDLKMRLAFNRMDKERCPLNMVDYYFYSELSNALEDFCYDNDLEAEDFDIEEILWEA